MAGIRAPLAGERALLWLVAIFARSGGDNRERHAGINAITP
jgi:hypothetical protein